MEPRADRQYTAFASGKRIASGEVLDVAVKVKKFLKKESGNSVLIFDDLTGDQVEIDFRGDVENVRRRLEDFLRFQQGKKVGPGRPRLGVTAKEITLLPEHWEWLAIQPGGASVTLRRLVEEAKKKNVSRDRIRQAQDRTYKFMTTMAGDLPDYEEALRALYGGDVKSFKDRVSAWPKDIQEHAWYLAKDALSK
ncbi:MAG TPA: DUF2239 family protein [Pseudobdellovibrionaceae bacterium]|nr:DUF2239 family protein [Pseudobdellovibrionaceae bacterium]